MALAKEGGDEESDEIQRGTLTCSGEYPGVGGSSVNGSEERSVVADGRGGVEGKVNLDDTERMRVGEVGRATGYATKVAFVANMTLNGGGFGDFR